MIASVVLFVLYLFSVALGSLMDCHKLQKLANQKHFQKNPFVPFARKHPFK